MTPSRFFISAIVFALVMAGCNGSSAGPPLSSVTFMQQQVLAPAGAARWQKGKAMPTARLGAAAAAIGKDIYVIGGYNKSGLVTANEIYNTATGNWKTGAPMPTGRFYFGAAAFKGKVYAIGGEIGSPCCVETNVLEVYDPVHNAWATMAPMPTSRNSVAVVADGKYVYAIGGYNGQRLANVERYDPAKNIWSVLSPMLVPKSNTNAGVIGSTIVAASGVGSSAEVTDTEVYSPAKNRWRALQPEPDARAASCTGVIDGLLYVAGGSDASNKDLRTVDVYSFKHNSWSQASSMLRATAGAGAAVAKKDLYCFGGASVSFPASGIKYFTNVQIYRP
jgi:N-acetylneuraminic acid mutarotase